MTTTAERVAPPELELDAAKREHSDLFRQWRGFDGRADEIRRARLSDLDRTLALAELRREKEELAPLLKAAIVRLQAARVAAANDKLPALVTAHKRAAAKAERRRKRAEKALVELAAALIAAGEALGDESQAARAALKAADPAVPSTDDREQLRRGARYHLPAAFGEDGDVAEWVERTPRGFFEGSHEIDDAIAYRGLERLAKVGRRRALNHLGGVMRSEVQKALARIDGN